LSVGSGLFEALYDARDENLGGGLGDKVVDFGVCVARSGGRWEGRDCGL